MREPLPKANDTSTTPIPSYIPEEMIPAWLWLKEKGLAALIMIVVGVLLVSAVAAYFSHGHQKAAQASAQLLAPPTIETLEKAVTDYGSTPAGIAAKLKLAKAYCDAAQYDQSLKAYEEFIKKHSAYPFADVARVGKGFALCGLNRMPEALEIFRTFRSQNPQHYLTPQAYLGEAACLTMQGNKSAATALLQELRAANRESAWENVAKRMEGAIERYQGATARPARTLLDQANTLAPAPVEAPAAAPKMAAPTP
jgi:tetratricopeptide (TPR) repeat protein